MSSKEKEARELTEAEKASLTKIANEVSEGRKSSISMKKSGLATTIPSRVPSSCVPVEFVYNN